MNVPGGSTFHRHDRAAEDALARLARSQHGIVARRQLFAAGFTRGLINSLVRKGRLEVVHRGVYEVRPALSPHAWAMAACLACGAQAVLSHASAGAINGVLRGPRRGPPEVTLRRGQRRPKGIRVHRTRSLRREEIIRIQGIPVTTAARTVFDLARTISPRRLDRIVAHVLARDVATPAQLRSVLARQRGGPGARVLREVLDRRTGRGRDGAEGSGTTRSEAEALFLALIRRAGLEDPETNARVEGYEVDCLWRRERVVVEVDGFRYHGVHPAFERDRRRDQILEGRGYRVIRVTWDQIVDEPEAVAISVDRVLTLSSTS